MKKNTLILFFFTIPSFGFSQNAKKATNDTFNVEWSTNHQIKGDTAITFSDAEMDGDNSELNIGQYLKSKWIELLGLLIAFLAFFLPIYKFITQKREEQKDKRFITYHKLIKDLVEPDDKGRIMLDRQIATAYELRNFPNYFDLTKRIFTDLKSQWEKDEKNNRIVAELSMTIAYIDVKSKWYSKLWRYLGILK